MLACNRCQASFKPKNKVQKFCSDYCRYEHWKVIQENNYNSFELFDRDSFTCIYCGRSSVVDKVKLNIDHIIAFDKGGKDIANNLVTCCSDCNVRKGTIELLSIEFVIKEVERRNVMFGIKNDSKIKIPTGIRK